MATVSILQLLERIDTEYDPILFNKLRPLPASVSEFERREAQMWIDQDIGDVFLLHGMESHFAAYLLQTLRHGSQ